MAQRIAIVWFREDLRLHDNPALDHACAHYEHVIPLYIHQPDEAGDWQPGAASRWWLHHALRALDGQLREHGNALLIRSGSTSLDCLAGLARETGAQAIVWNRQYTPQAMARDSAIKARLREAGLTVTSFRGGLLFEPHEVHKDDGTPYRVFTAWWRRCHTMDLYQPELPAPATLPGLAGIDGIALDSLGLLPRQPWDDGFYQYWQPGELQARARLEQFMEGAVAQYDHARDYPAIAGTSRLSPHLHYGEISPRTIVNRALQQANAPGGAATHRSLERLMTEVGWRDFAAHILYHYPDSPDTAMDARFRRFPWQRNYRTALQCWQHGQTGFPVIDAGMRELWHTGWMHNRVRMLVASFLAKNLLIPWQEGARWFWDTLLDADLASNTLGWQWVAGCGTDAAPYFRIFNPVTQGKKFDPDGEYVRRWVPELAALDTRCVHEPWKSGLDLAYPAPMVDLQATRIRALDAFKSLRGQA
ncbi:MAG TPA: deoxyribodipyrimidine photo-lyase [Gammaproteobacteria bacterium]|nr:deoxyribodipyrimidine photo-lyase [Gammaproteobacteria bacterium]